MHIVKKYLKVLTTDARFFFVHALIYICNIFVVVLPPEIQIYFKSTVQGRCTNLDKVYSFKK